MPVGPHTITITVKDDDNSTAVEGATISIKNITKKSSLTGSQKTNSSGQAMVDLANLPLIGGQSNEYDDGDEILIIAYKGHKHDAEFYTVNGESHDTTLNLNPITYSGRYERLMAIVTGNTAASVAYCKVYAVDDGELLAHIETPANNSQAVEFGHFGKAASGGFVVVREANTLIVTAAVK